MSQPAYPRGPLLEQLTWYWENQAWPRLQGLSDAEYFWEPVADTWTVRRREQAVYPPVGAGDWVIDWSHPVPAPPPVTTIAWRLGHLIVGVFGERAARYFDAPPASYDGWEYAGTAHQALDQLQRTYQSWVSGVAGLDVAGLEARCREVGWESESMTALVQHINREAIHHLAEVALLRDLYLRQPVGVREQ